MSISSINPATGELLKEFQPFTAAQIERVLVAAANAAVAARRRPIEKRTALMRRAADILRSEKRSLGELMTLEMGKPIKAAIAEAEKCASACGYYADHAAEFLADRSVEVDNGSARVAFQPLGVVLAVMPWNFPFWQVFRFAAPALVAGNAALLKHASNVPQCALAIEDVFRRAGFDGNEFQTLLIGSGGVEAIVGDSRVAAVTLTGSEAAGSSVAAAAGKHLKKTVLELGGSDPFIVMPSADFDAALATAVTARMINNGQSCIAAKRFIIHAEIYERFLAGFVEKMKAVRIGDPMDQATGLGPLATDAIRRDLHAQVERTVALGARLLTGGRPRAGAGFYYEPTVLAAIPADSPAARDELFGPVASVFMVRNFDEAIRLANSTRYGLGASAWTSDADEQRRFATEIESGSVFINEMVASDPRLPFGGVKSSGYGRELSDFGIREFVNVKTVKVAAEKKHRDQSSGGGAGKHTE